VHWLSAKLCARLALVATVFLFVAALDAAPPARIVAIGDVHGAADRLTSLLVRAGLIDSRQRWTGSTAILVQTGDVTDRGAGVRAALDLLMALEPQAAAAGGKVQVLLGNHEVMNLLGDTHDATPEIFRSFADAESETRRTRAFDRMVNLQRRSRLALPDKAEWLAAHPPGYIEYREAFKPNGRYGRWLRSKPILATIEGTVFLHAGIDPAVTTDSLDGINRRARRELAAWDAGVRWLEEHQLVLPFATALEVVAAADAQLRQFLSRADWAQASPEDIDAARHLEPLVRIGDSSLSHPGGPLWFRGYSTWTDAEGAPLMAALLRKYRVSRFVTGHTPQASSRVTSRFNGALFLIDTGMLGGTFYPGGRASALEITGDKVTPIYDD
jgi:hypothetical protein